MSEFPTCKNCGERIELINFAMGSEWRHWPTRYGSYLTSEKYWHCRTSRVAEPAEESSDD